MTASETFHVSRAEYLRFRELIARTTGLDFPDNRRHDFERALLEGLAESGLQSLDRYYEALVEGRPPGLPAALINLLTIGETYFNRDSAQFDLLRHEVLPKLIAERMTTDRSLRIWSAGCATGEEPYSVAIILRELVPYIDTWNVMIMATDINSDSLKKAERGRYRQWSFRNMPQEWLDKYFFASPKADFHLSDLIKGHVSFEYLNLKEKSWPSFLNKTVDLDLIICRNVTIYFDDQTTADIMSRFHSSLAEGGWLLTGASDPVPPRERFRPRNFSGAFIYQKKSPGFEARRRKRTEKTSRNDKPNRPSGSRGKDVCLEGKTLLEIGQPGLAAEKLAAGLKLDPDSTNALLLMAKTEAARGDLGRAEEYAQKVIKFNKLDIRAYYLLSAIYQGLGEEDKSIEYLKKTLYLDPDFFAAHFTLGCLYKRQNKALLANKAFKNVLRLMVGRSKDEIVPETNGITCGKLREIVENSLKQE
jgi:chemotaxis protein methyltransferase CheR